MLSGRSATLGATVVEGGVNFAIWAPQAERVELCLYDADGVTEINRLTLPGFDSGVWHGYLEGAGDGLIYGIRSHGQWALEQGLRFNSSKLLIDPWCRELVGDYRWHESQRDQIDGEPNTEDSAATVFKCRVTRDFCQSVDRPCLDPDRRIIYEAHVKGISQMDERVPPCDRGTFRGLASSHVIDHLLELGVTTLQLMPVQAFVDEQFLYAKGLKNYWGYNPVSWFAPHPAYGTYRDFRCMVEVLHEAGLEVIIDVVLNHTAEGGETGPHLSLKGLDNRGFYLSDAQQGYLNYTGCGNTLNAKSVIAQRLVLESLSYWYEVLGVDGFRFDLASTLARTPQGFDIENSLMGMIAHHPPLTNALLIAEPWDLGPDGYQAGNFGPRISEWNDGFRDDIRSFWLRGDRSLSSFAHRMTASRDRFHRDGRNPQSSVHFVCAHDGFSLTDLTCYDRKHNHANGENNRDGHNDNRSYNHGVEGPSVDPGIQRARRSIVRAMLTSVMISQGTPMILMGDELGHSRQGNNNAWCQDNELNWIDWQSIDQELLDFVRRLVAARNQNPALRIAHWVEPGGQAIQWLTPEGQPMGDSNWHDPECRAMQVIPTIADCSALVLINATSEPVEFRLPSQQYWLKIDSADPVHELPAKLPLAGYWTVPAGSVQVSDRDLDEVDESVLTQSGIQRSYSDANGVNRSSTVESVRAIMASMGSPQDSGSELPMDSSVSCFAPQWCRDGEQMIGIGLQLYGLRSDRNWGIGDFSDLAAIANLAGDWVNFIALNPLHARPLAHPEQRSPYAPTSRVWLDPVYIAPDLVADMLGVKLNNPVGLEILRRTALVDYVAVTDTKLRALVSLFLEFKKPECRGDLHSRFHQFCKTGGESLQAYVEDETKSILKIGPGWSNLLQTAWLPTFLQWLQWLANIQLGAAQDACLRRGMKIGLYRDLAVGPGLGGMEAGLDVFARGIEVGAPPDAFSETGQAWGIAPLNPAADGIENFFRNLIRSNMAEAGALRIDHVMGLSRLFWIPKGFDALDGAYVHYGSRLMKILSEVSQEECCLVIGEDLGTLPDGYRDQLGHNHVFGLSIAMFEKFADHFIDPRHYRRLSVASFGTHDLPTIRGWWQGRDIELWRSLSMISNQRHDQLQLQRTHERDQLCGLVGIAPGQNETDVARAVHGWLKHSGSAMIQVQLDDLTGETEPLNVPGTVDEYPNWARKYSLSIDLISWSEFDAGALV